MPKKAKLEQARQSQPECLELLKEFDVKEAPVALGAFYGLTVLRKCGYRLLRVH
jgi:hypothetical protein